MATTTSPRPSPPASALPVPDPIPWKSYTYTPTEKSIFAPSPYKSLLLPHWRFATPQSAQHSAQKIYAYFLVFVERDDFVGADNARKFLQMGMTRAGRYANYKGGRKYVQGGREVGKRRKVEAEEGDWDGREEKREASRTFRGYWERAKGSERYEQMKEEFLERQREWKKRRKS